MKALLEDFRWLIGVNVPCDQGAVRVKAHRATALLVESNSYSIGVHDRVRL